MFYFADFDNPRPPEGLSHEPCHAPLSPAPDDPTLIEMFLTELQSHAPSALSQSEDSGDLIRMGIFDHIVEPELHSGPTSVPDSPPSPLPALECMPVDSDPLDDPFLASFTDVSLLQENCPLFSGGLDDSPPVPPSPAPQLTDNSVNVTIVESSIYNSNTCSQGVLDLSECVNSLVNSSPSDPLSSSSTSSSTTPSVPSPVSMETHSHQTSHLFDFDFSAISEQDLTNVINQFSEATPSPPSISTTPLSSSSTSRETTPLSDDRHAPVDTSVVPKQNRKRKSIDSPSTEGRKVPRISCDTESVGDKKKVRRDKNNVASRVSRAKRKERRKALDVRADELEEDNARLRVRVAEMTAETERLKKLLLERLVK